MAGSILVVRGLVEALEHSGVAREAFFRSAAFDASRLETNDARIDLDELDALHEVALDLTGNEAFGLEVGEAANSTTYNLAAHLVAHAATLRQGLTELIRFHRLLTDRLCWQLDEKEETATLRYEVAPGPLRCRRFRSEVTVTGFYRMLRHFDAAKRPDAVLFDYPAPGYRAEYERVFDGSVLFEQPFTGIVFDRRVLDAEQLHRDREFHAALQTQAEKRVARLDRKTTYSERVREYVLVSAPPDRHNMEAVARGLGLSGRSLRRRLREEGKSYGAIVESALATVAKRLISDEQRSIEATAYAMGYSDATAFHRAFKRWTGSTPGAYRSSRPPPDLTRDDRDARQQAGLQN